MDSSRFTGTPITNARASDGCTRMPGATVLLLQDVVPWFAAANQDPRGADVTELLAQGRPFDICTSDQLGIIQLSQYRDIKIASAQTQTFYDNLFPGGVVHPALTAWVAAGGVLSANLADFASGPGNGGVWRGTFVGGLTKVVDFTDDLAIASPSHPVITGAMGGANGGPIVDVAPYNDLDCWNSSSHGYFTNLPSGTATILAYDLGGGVPDPTRPVMIQYPFGSGTVIASMTTTEWMYSGGPGTLPQNRKLLANELGYEESTGPCTVVGYQEVCVDADVAITVTATPGDVVSACLTTPAVLPFGTRTCRPTGIPCGFSVQVTLCVAVPVSFGAKAATVAVEQQCQLPTATSCLLPPGSAPCP